MTGCPLLDSEYAARQNGKRLPCERLAEENAKLLMRVNAEHIVRQNLAAENAKLRELVQSYHSAMLCMLETDIWPTDPEWLEHRMRELGVDA